MFSNKVLENLSLEELRMFFGKQQHTPKQKAQAFVRERFLEIQAGDGIIPIDVSDGSLVMHLIPLIDFEEDRRNKIPDLSSQQYLLPIYSGGDGFINLEGYGISSEEEYTQIFRNGSLEAVSTNILKKRNGNLIIGGGHLPKIIASVMNRYMKELKENGASVPILLQISAMNIKGVKLFLNNDGDNCIYNDTIIHLPSSLIDKYDDNDDYTNVTIEQMNYLWNAFGIEKCNYSFQ